MQVYSKILAAVIRPVLLAIPVALACLALTLLVRLLITALG